jgi:LacI family transcriptional regulator/LacI family repressor for deo operon, udp, cdd, tsx, nupC, and nupG
MKRGKPEKYIGLAGEIRKLVKERNLKTGDALPPERKLAELYACNHLTIRKALRLLENEKLIHKVPSKGNFVGHRSTASPTKGIIGFIFPDDEIFYYKIFSALESKFSELNLHPIVHLTHNIKEKEEKILIFLESVGADALIAVPNLQCLESYRKLTVPLLFFDLYLKELPVPYVITDDYQGATSAIECLLSLGHRKIAYVSGTYDLTSKLRCQGYLDTLEKNGVKIYPEYIKCQEPTREWGYYAARELFNSADSPTAIFCGNDTVAAGVIRYFTAQKISVPDDCSIIAFGNTPIVEDLNLASVSQNSSKIIDALGSNLQIILKGETAPRETLISTNLVLRGSTAPPQS